MENDLEDLFTYGIRIIDDIKDRQQGLDYLRQIIEKINNSNKKLKDKLYETEKKLQDLANSNKEKDREIQLLKNNENKLSKEINDLKNENQCLHIDSEKFKALYYEQEKGIEGVKVLLSEKNNDLKNKEEIISKLDEDLKNKKKEIEEKDNKINSLQAQLLGLQSDKEQGKVINDYLQKIDIVEGSIKALLEDIRDIKLDEKNKNLPEVYGNETYTPNESDENLEEQEDKNCQNQIKGASPSSHDEESQRVDILPNDSNDHIQHD